MRPMIAVLLAAFAMLLSVAPARASEPSGACKDGAALCREAVERLKDCQTKNPGNAGACVGESAEADNACKTTTSACHTDGSRTPPSSPPSNAPAKK